MPLVCLPLYLMLGLLGKGGQSGLALGAPICKQGVSETVVAINDPKAKLEVPVFLERF